MPSVFIFKIFDSKQTIYLQKLHLRDDLFSQNEENRKDAKTP
jgi:hypothetical protein